MAQQNTVVDVKQNLATVQQMMAKYNDQIAAALPKHITSDRMARIAITEIRKSALLSKANPISLLGAIVQAAQLGLEPGGALGHCYLVPYKGEIQLQIGYRGMIELARRSAQVLSISAHVVYEGDSFSFQYGLREDLTHVPASPSKRGNPTHVYATAKLVGGGEQFIVLDWEEIIRTRNDSDGYKAFKAGRIKSTPWDSHMDEMARKTAVRRLFKYLPVSIEIQRATALDELADAGKRQHNAAIIDADFLVTDDEDEQSTGATMKDQIKRTDEPKPEQATAIAEPEKTDVVDKAYCLTLLNDSKSVEDIDYVRSLAAGHLKGIDLADVQKAIAEFNLPAATE